MKFYIALITLILLTMINVQHTYAQNKHPSKPLISIKKYPSFGLPLDCDMGKNCWVMNYVDIGIGDQKKTDPACFDRTYDGHKGTDFAILDGRAMKSGVNVLAAKDGTVKRIRDGEEDKWATRDQLKKIKVIRKECGNAALIDHGEGVETIYCHMKKGSLKIKADQKIKKGDVIGEVGLSGFTQFPHLHFGVLINGKITDPFTGQNNDGQCGKRKASLWGKNLDVYYQPLTITSHGFSNQIPNLSALEKDVNIPDLVPLTSELLTYWVTILGAREDDQIQIQIKDPNGKIFAARDIIQSKARARQLYYAGRKTSNIPLKEGAYTGQVSITRKGRGEAPLKWSESSSILVSR